MKSILSLALGAGLAIASPAVVGDLIEAGLESNFSAALIASLEPCGTIAAILDNDVNKTFPLNPDLAFACLNSVPLDVPRNVDLIKGFRSLAEFHSITAYLKNPPPGYLYPAVDLLAVLDDIKTKLERGYYKNEYSFQWALHEWSKTSHDYHLTYLPDILSAFEFLRPQSLISVSSDGLALPEVYTFLDAVALNLNSTKVSPIVEIDKTPVDTWLNAYASLDPYGHDPDANLNSVYYQVPNDALIGSGGSGTFTKSSRYQGNNTVLTFANKTSINLPSFATTSLNFSGIVDGKTFFEKFCTGLLDLPTPPQNKTENSTVIVQAPFVPIPANATPVTIPAYPSPLIVSKETAVAGFLPKDKPDLAVLSIPSFDTGEDVTAAFQNAVRGLLATAKAENRTKLIIDLRNNGGGNAYLAYDVFKQLFPSKTPYGASSIRSHTLYQDLANVFGDLYKGRDPDTITDKNEQSLHGTFLNPAAPLDVDLKPFKDTQAYLGPYKTYGDNFTALARTNLNVPFDTSPVVVYGYANNTRPQPQVFQPKDILIIQDGLCGSTCAIFSEFMKSQAKVKSIAFAGRKAYGPMQAVGGTKGSEVVSLESVGTLLLYAKKLATPERNATLNAHFPNLMTEGEILYNRTKTGKGLRWNIRNNIREGDKSRTPLQFVYEAADCKLFYTPAMLIDQSKVWSAAYNAHWANGACVAGSTGHQSSLSGDLLSYINAEPPVGANYTCGAGVNATVYPGGVRNNATVSVSKALPVTIKSTGTARIPSGTGYLRSTAIASASAKATAKPSLTSTSAVRPTASATSQAASPKYTGAAGRLDATSMSGVVATLGAMFALFLI